MNLLSKYQGMKRATEVLDRDDGFRDSERDILQGFGADRALRLLILQAKEILEGTLIEITRSHTLEHQALVPRTEIPTLPLEYANDCDRFPAPEGDCQDYSMRLHNSTGDLRPWCRSKRCWCLVADPSEKEVDTPGNRQQYQQKPLSTADDAMPHALCEETDPETCEFRVSAGNAVTGERWFLCRQLREEYEERENVKLDPHHRTFGKRHQGLIRRLMRRCLKGGDAMEPDRQKEGRPGAGRPLYKRDSAV